MNTASGIVLTFWFAGCTQSVQVAHKTVTYREYYARCCSNTILIPDDEHSDARNMWRITIINRFIQRHCASSWSFSHGYTRIHGQQNIKFSKT